MGFEIRGRFVPGVNINCTINVKWTQLLSWTVILSDISFISSRAVCMELLIKQFKLKMFIYLNNSTAIAFFYCILKLNNVHINVVYPLIRTVCSVFEELFKFKVPKKTVQLLSLYIVTLHQLLSYLIKYTVQVTYILQRLHMNQRNHFLFIG